MKLVFQQISIDLDDTITGEEVIKKINSLLDEGYYFSHFIADGVEVFEEHEHFLNTKLWNLEQIEIIAKTVKEFTNDILLSIESYTGQAIPHLATLSSEFYNNPSRDTWSQFAELMESLQWVNEVMELLRNQEEKIFNWTEYEEVADNIQEELVNLQDAIENDDFILIADIVQYEISPNFEALHEAAKTTIDTEGTRPNLN